MPTIKSGLSRRIFIVRPLILSIIAAATPINWLDATHAERSLREELPPTMLFDESQANATQKFDGLVATPLADRGHEQH